MDRFGRATVDAANDDVHNNDVNNNDNINDDESERNALFRQRCGIFFVELQFYLSAVSTFVSLLFWAKVVPFFSFFL